MVTKADPMSNSTFACAFWPNKVRMMFVGCSPKIVAYKSRNWTALLRQLSLSIHCLHKSFQTNLHQIIQDVWRRRCCSCRWQWLRHVQSWICWRWCSQSCLSLHCWPPSPPGNHTITFHTKILFQMMKTYHNDYKWSVYLDSEQHLPLT